MWEFCEKVYLNILLPWNSFHMTWHPQINIKKNKMKRENVIKIQRKNGRRARLNVYTTFCVNLEGIILESILLWTDSICVMQVTNLFYTASGICRKLWKLLMTLCWQVRELLVTPQGECYYLFLFSVWKRSSISKAAQIALSLWL